MGKKINLGCGEKRIDGFLGVDRLKTPAVDVIHDLNKFPYPFADNSAQEILMDNVLEHLEDTVRVMEEIFRICQPGARVEIRVPYYKSSGAFTDPTHKKFFTESSFDYFASEHPYHYYTKANFEIISVKLIAHKKFKDWKHFFRNLIPLKPLFNHFLFNIYDEIYFELKCLK
ncbi:MAG: methyltransferase domain-containing protein [Patescibacteria group bacterium]|nr:methyltransferase domain-containing protein [Patescibacteria group bacterium]